jgi:hypothetical protein
VRLRYDVVENGARLRIAQEAIGLMKLLEALARHAFAGIDVGMRSFRELAEGGLDLSVVGTGRQTECLVKATHDR